jgi:hypothetical protein
MKSLNLKYFSLFVLLAAAPALAAVDNLPANDPFPYQFEANTNQVAVPMEASSFYALAGVNASATNDPTPAPKKGDAGLEFCHTDKWSEACLTGLLIYRCAQYTFPLTPYGCALAATTFVGSLELTRINVVVGNASYSLPVIYIQRLERMIQDPKTQENLKTLRSLLVGAAKNKTPFDLYRWFSTTAKGNFDQTLENLSVILQDTSGVEIQVNYLKGIAKSRAFGPAAEAAIANLDEIVYQLNSETLYGEDYQKWLKLYPAIKGIETDATPLIYHFYPMAFQARTLQRAGFGNRLSSFIPFLFNTEYLSQKLDPDLWPIHHPKPFPLNDGNWWEMHDMYSGFAGAHFGVQKAGLLQGGATFEKEYSQAPYETMRHLFWSMPNP